MGKVFSFKNDRDGMEKAIGMIENVKNQNNLSKVLIGIEPSGQYWKAAAHYLQERGYTLALINPYHVKKIKELEDNSQTKNDIKDCLLVAKLVRDGNYFNLNIVCGIYAELQRLSRFRLKIKKAFIREKTKLRTLLDEYFPEYEGMFFCHNFVTTKYGEVPLINSATTYNEENDELTLFLLNCDTQNDIELLLTIEGFGPVKIVEHLVMNGNDLFASNTFEEPNKVIPRLNLVEKSIGEEFDIILPKLSWNVIRFEIEG